MAAPFLIKTIANCFVRNADHYNREDRQRCFAVGRIRQQEALTGSAIINKIDSTKHDYTCSCLHVLFIIDRTVEFQSVH